MVTNVKDDQSYRLNWLIIQKTLRISSRNADQLNRTTLSYHLMIRCSLFFNYYSCKAASGQALDMQYICFFHTTGFTFYRLRIVSVFEYLKGIV